MNLKKYIALALMSSLLACARSSDTNIAHGIAQVPIAPPSCPQDEPVASNGSPVLKQTGRWLTDAQGRVVVLHGLNQINKFSPYEPMVLGFGDDDAAYMASQGFNTLRIGVIYKAFEPMPGVYDDAYLEKLAQLAELLGRHGIYTLLDFHQDMYNERYNGEGMPDWASIDDVPVGMPKCTPDLGFPGNYFTCAPLWQAFDNFWNNTAVAGLGMQERYALAWARVAARFKSIPSVFGYDIFNEPFPGSDYALCASPLGCTTNFDDKLTAFHVKVAAAIRAVDPAKVIYYEPNVEFNSGADTKHGDVMDDNAGLSFHLYCLAATPGLPTLPGTELCRGTGEKIVFDNAEKHIQRYNKTSLITEFGATDDNATIQRVTEGADAAMIGWQEWAWWNRDVCCDRPAEGLIIDISKPPSDDNLKQAKLDAMVRAYPRTVAGTPTAWAFNNNTKLFTLNYNTAKADGTGRSNSSLLSEVWLPKRQYPKGYVVTVTGAQVTSAPNAERLLLQATNCASQVQVSVSPRP